MKTISSIQWTVESIEHVARHNIRPEEIEEACFNDEEPPLVRSGRQNLHYVFGKAFSGRFLFIVVRFMKRGVVKVITAREMNRWERDYFKTRGKL